MRSPYIRTASIAKFSTASTQTDLPLDITKPPQESPEPNPNLIFPVSKDGPWIDPGPHVHAQHSSKAFPDAHLSNLASFDDSEGDIIESASSPLVQDEQSSVWLNGAGWEIDSHSGNNSISSDSDIPKEGGYDEHQAASPSLSSSIQTSPPEREAPTHSSTQYATSRELPYGTPPKPPRSDVQVMHRDFFVLVKFLQRHVVQGCTRLPLKQLLRDIILQNTRKGPEKTDSTGFAKTVDLAIEAGVIEMGGSGGGAWIGLNPKWHGAELM